MEIIFTSQSKEGEKERTCEAFVLWGILESAISQNMAQRDDLIDAFITDEMTAGKTHGSFLATLSAWLPIEYQLMRRLN